MRKAGVKWAVAPDHRADDIAPDQFGNGIDHDTFDRITACIGLALFSD